MKLLIVDDSMVIRRKIERDITLLDINEVYQAVNGLEALRLCKQHMPDLVTMDLTMPEMDGVECIRHLIAMHPAAVILVISALADKATAIKAIKNGARGFLCKPFTEEELNKALLQLLDDARKKVAV